MKITFKTRLLTSLLLPVLSGFCSCTSTESKAPEHPNILAVMTDQQSASMMSCAGNKWLKTPVAK